MWRTDVPSGSKPLGYRALVEFFELGPLYHYRWSYTSSHWKKCEHYYNDQNIVLHLYPQSSKAAENVFDHFEFALKYEGVNLQILKQSLLKLNPTELEKYVQSQSTGKYARILWYLYENFAGKKLSLPDLKQGNYVPLLDPDNYYTSKDGVKSTRQRIQVNLLGTLQYSPLIRRTALLASYEDKKISNMAYDIEQKYDPSLLGRAMRYLYTKETMSSWEIEREKPDQSKLTKFMNLLNKADSIGPLSESVLVELQKQIIDPRFVIESYRTFQNYIGEEPGMGRMMVHYISPKHENVKDLMEGLIKTFEIMEQSHIDPVVVAAVLSFGLVFIHPFEDGNGRMHRFLIHYALAKLKFTPSGVVFPISSVIVKNPLQYDRVLELVSKPLMERITHFKVDDTGALTVFGDTVDEYRYIDFTHLAEYLYQCVETTVEMDFSQELAFLVNYDRIKQACKLVVDMPDQKIDLLIKCVRQNAGVLSDRKKKDYFSMLSDDEIQRLQAIITPLAK